MSNPTTAADVQSLRDKTEHLPSDLRALSTLIHSLRTALVAEGLVKGLTLVNAARPLWTAGCALCRGQGRYSSGCITVELT